MGATFERRHAQYWVQFARIMAGGIARTVTATGQAPDAVARELVAKLDGEGLVLALVFADWRIDPVQLARAMHEKLPAPVVGCTTVGVIGGGGQPSAAALGLYSDRINATIGVATELPKSALARSRDAMLAAAAALGTKADALEPSRHVAITLVDGTCRHEEAFCIGSAATAPQIRVIGGCAASEPHTPRRAAVWTNGEAMADAGVVILLETDIPFEAITSHHMIATDVKTVVTSTSHMQLDQLDGRPATVRLRELVARAGGTLDPAKPWEYAFARFIDGVPYLRSMLRINDTSIHLACDVAVGHVLRLMRPGDMIGQTRRDLESVQHRLGGEISALLTFSCISRHWEAGARGTQRALDALYGSYPTIGLQTAGEQSGMVLVNHTLTGLALGAPKGFA
jgi:hypothetical protein